MDPKPIEISTDLGKLKGLIKESVGVSKKTYYSFQGIPYAKPPVGELRFKVSEPFGKWDGVWDATKDRSDSIQMHVLFGFLEGDEDCLYLNVFTPQKPGKVATKKAVMVWIHGGGFACGSGSSELYGPDYLVEQDVVLVTINYRCGALGFLSLENEKMPGNLGLKDQTLALRWVRDNIHSFGGDATNVTVFGESAGGASANYHVISPLSKGLFHKIIMQSGSPVCPWTFQPKPKEKALLLAKELGCTSQDPDAVLDFLMTVPAKDIVQAQHKEILFTERERVQKLSFIFLPCIEVAGDAPFLSDSPRKLMERGQFTKVPLLIGVTDKEGLVGLEIKTVRMEKVNEDLSVLVPMDLNVTGGIAEERKVGKEILQFYTKKDVLSWEVMVDFLDVVTDSQFFLGVDKSRQCFLRHSSEPVYTYKFSYSSPRALSSFLLTSSYPDKAKELLSSGVCHLDDLVHLFKTNMKQVPFVPPTPDDQVFMNQLLKVWTNFAKNGDPNCKELGVTLKPDSKQHPSYVDLRKVSKIVNGIIFPERVDFWKKLYEKYSYAY